MAALRLSQPPPPPPRAACSIDNRSNISTSTAASENLKVYVTKTHPSKLINLIGTYCGKKLKVLLDSGADRSYIHPTLVSECGLITQLTSPKSVTLADDSTVTVDQLVPSFGFKLGKVRVKAQPLILPLSKYDVLLGMDWLEQYNPPVDWVTKLVTIGGVTLPLYPISDDSEGASVIHHISYERLDKHLRKGKFTEAYMVRVQSTELEASSPFDALHPDDTAPLQVDLNALAAAASTHHH
jgi:hypothetical protein